MVVNTAEQLHENFLKAVWFSNEVENAVKITSKWVDTSFYTSSWVNIEIWDDFSATAWKVCKASYNNSPFITVESMWSWSFRWPKWFQIINLPKDIYYTHAPDGCWTKPILIETLWNFMWAADDVVSMTGDDIAR